MQGVDASALGYWDPNPFLMEYPIRGLVLGVKEHMEGRPRTSREGNGFGGPVT